MHKYISDNSAATALVETLAFLNPRNEALICGGYVRDRIMGGIPTDIDVRAQVPRGPLREYAERVKDLVGYKLMRHLPDLELRGEEYPDTDFTTFRITLVQNPRNGAAFVRPTHIDLMLQRNPVVPAQVFETFDFGICEAGITSRGVVTSERFEAALADGVDVSRNPTTIAGRDRQQEHADRITHKYPWMTMTVSPLRHRLNIARTARVGDTIHVPLPQAQVIGMDADGQVIGEPLLRQIAVPVTERDVANGYVEVFAE